MERISLENELKSNSYPGRGIIIGRSADGTKAVTACRRTYGSCYGYPGW